ncbi:MAG TPA: transglycosylase SLT domain-containing protein [Methylophilaceae bacterium]|nr:transglycosylase SLT domain-containing protein [Methylophilaceae bacterium]HQC28851.1 transglycosylase SLT domain-containing protein [Methylotenera sp.]
MYKAFQYLLLLLLLVSGSTFAGSQIEEPLSNSVKAMMQRSISDKAAPRLIFATPEEGQAWLNEMSKRLEKRIPNAAYREDVLRTVHYEATRAGLDPQMVLGLIQVESGFKKYAVSSVGARGFMQIMPFWVKSIGDKDHNLFQLRTNLRYGCTILRHYLDIERGDLYRALGRYNGSLGRPQYPNLVLGAWRKHWHYTPQFGAGAIKVTENTQSTSESTLKTAQN